MEQINAVLGLYEQYLKIARLTELPTAAELESPEYVASPPAPMTLTISSR